MNKQWFTVHVLIATLGAVFASGCMAQTNDLGDETDAEGEQLGEVQQSLSGGGSGGGGPTLPPPDCTGKGSCYCLCRLSHPCAQDPAQCSPLSQCLTSCDYQYPSYCTETGNPNPTTASDCF